MRHCLTFIAAVFLGSVVAQCVQAAERTPPGSYLVYRATTVGELRNQVAKNAVVRARYIRHFGVSPTELDSFFADELCLVSLKEPLRTKCWYVDKSGRQVIKTKLLPRGTMVFATINGKPVLSWSCGNPLRADLPMTLVKPSTEKPETKVLPSVETISTAVVMAPPAPAVVSALPVTTPPVLATVAAPAVSAPPIIAGSAGILGLLGGIAFKSGGHTPNIPEPSSFVMLGSLLAMLPGAYRLSRRRR
jgi:hypothetical protein